MCYRSQKEYMTYDLVLQGRYQALGKTEPVAIKDNTLNVRNVNNKHHQILLS